MNANEEAERAARRMEQAAIADSAFNSFWIPLIVLALGAMFVYSVVAG